MKYDESNPFARILRGELPCIKVAETDATLAFMDLMPQADGHVLVVPKESAAEIFELSDAATVACMRMTQKIAVALRAASGHPCSSAASSLVAHSFWSHASSAHNSLTLSPPSLPSPPWFWLSVSVPNPKS